MSVRSSQLILLLVFYILTDFLTPSQLQEKIVDINYSHEYICFSSFVSFLLMEFEVQFLSANTFMIYLPGEPTLWSL